MTHEDFAKELQQDLDSQHFMCVGRRQFDHGVREGLRRAMWLLQRRTKAQTEKEKPNG